MAKLPRPKGAAALPAATARDIRTLDAGTVLARVYFADGAHPTRWDAFRTYGPTLARYDHHRPDPTAGAVDQPRSVLYAATDARTCLAEVFQHTRRIDRVRNAPWLVIFALHKPVRLLDLTGTYPTRCGASMAIDSGPRNRARGWAQRFYDEHRDLHGLFYASSMHANRPAIVLTDRAAALGVLPAHPQFNRALADDLLLDVLKHAALDLGYGLR
jgi:RES domain